MNTSALLMIVAGLALFGAAWWAYSKRRAIADTPTSKVRSMAIGPVEITGVATLPPRGDYQRGPFTDEPCLYWEYKVEELRKRHTKSGTQTYWATVASAHSKKPIGVRDDTGVGVVDPQGAELPAPLKTQYGSGFMREPPARVIEFLQAHHIAHETLLGFDKNMRYTEQRLMEGTTLYVLGNATRREGAVGEGNDALVVQREGDGTFLVSTGSEKKLLLKWTLLIWVNLVVGIALAAWGTWMGVG